MLEAVAEWQGCPLDACYPLVFFDAIRVKIRDEGFVRNKAVYIALGIVHLLRNSMSFASWKDRKPIAQALRAVYRADTAEAGPAALDAFEAGIGASGTPRSRRAGGASGTR